MTNEQFAEQYWARKKKFDAGKISEEEMQRWENELRAALRKSIQKQKKSRTGKDRPRNYGDCIKGEQ